MHRLAPLLQQQDGVVSRRQLRATGIGDPDIRRWLRRRELAVVHPGVYVAHTGPLTWHQRAWPAVLGNVRPVRTRPHRPARRRPARPWSARPWRWATAWPCTPSATPPCS